jgi:hypothetical protein
VRNKGWWDEVGGGDKKKRNIREMVDADSPRKWRNNIPARRLPVVPDGPTLPLSLPESVLPSYCSLYTALCLQGV